MSYFINMNMERNITKKSQKNQNMNYPEIISSIDSLILNEEFYKIQTIMNDIFMNSSFIKETLQKKEIIEKLSKILLNNNENTIYISLSFINLLESKINNIPSYILEPILIDNEKIVNMLKIILEQVYLKNSYINNFEIPNIKNFINFVFKYPDIINNYFEISFINISNYYNNLFIMLLKNKQILKINNNDIIHKIFILKLFDILYTSFLDESIDISKIKDFFEILEDEEIYKDDYIKKFFIFSNYNKKEDFEKIGKIYFFIKNFEKFFFFCN